MSCYAGRQILLPTQHQKAMALAPAFKNVLDAEIAEIIIDTDQFGTFSGEVERPGDAQACAKLKCEAALAITDTPYAVASEGSFGPHPVIPILACNHELLYFIDHENDFHLSLTKLCTDTNYRMATVENVDQLHTFAKQTYFTSHALMIRPNIWADQKIIFKGLQTYEALHQAFIVACQNSGDGQAFVQTEMRAHFNPTRMRNIAKLAGDLAKRLCSICPVCQTPGWGKIAIKTGLPCSWCQTKTNLVKNEIWGCAKCDYQEAKERLDGLRAAEPTYCPSCNP